MYADYAAATPLSSRALKAMRSAEKAFWHNPSALYAGGVAAATILSSARRKIAKVIGAEPDEIVFTSGGTEANNLAIQGVILMYVHKDMNKNAKPRILVSSIDHPSLTRAADNFSQTDISLIPADDAGHLDLKALKKELSRKPIIISFGLINGEIGTIQKVRDIMKIVRSHRKDNKTRMPYVHLDASAAAGILPLDKNVLGIDMMTLDSGKIYGPKGVGALFVKRGVALEAVFRGGGQERGLRAGTENVSCIAGFAEALVEAEEKRPAENKRLAKLQKNFLRLITKHFPEAVLNGPDIGVFRHPGNVNICFPGLLAEQAVLILDSEGVSASASSACENLEDEIFSSAVKKDCAFSSLRFSFGRGTTEKDLNVIIAALKRAVPQATGTHIKLSHSK